MKATLKYLPLYNKDANFKFIDDDNFKIVISFNEVKIKKKMVKRIGSAKGGYWEVIDN